MPPGAACAGRAPKIVAEATRIEALASVVAKQGWGLREMRPETLTLEEIFLSLVATADWNADGCSDVLQVRTVLVSDCAGGFKDVVTSPTRATGDGPHTVLPADWNGDGRTDLLYVDYYTNTWHVIPSTGDGAGVFGPANPTAVMDASGNWTLSITFPFGIIPGLTIFNQGVVITTTSTPPPPNGAFHITDLEIVNT